MHTQSDQDSKKNKMTRVRRHDTDDTSVLPIGRIRSIEDFQNQIKRSKEFRLNRKRPFITVSYAQSIDGSIAARNKQQLHLSGPQSLRLTHQIRACCDSILIGIGTLLADNPRLSVRRVEGKNPQPIILDTYLRTPTDAKVVQRSDTRPWIVNGPRSSRKQTTALRRAGAVPTSCAIGDDGRIDLYSLMELLAGKNVNTVMVEGGARVITSFINAGLVDQFVITIAPKMVGGLPVIDGQGLNGAACLDLGQVNYQNLGEDMIMWARPLWKSE